MTILALDIGKKRIGVARSDALGITSVVLPNILYKDDKTVFDQLKKIINERDIKKIVVGMPKNMDGTLGKQAQFVTDFIEKLRKEFELEIIEWDERFSSKVAERVLHETGIKWHKRKDKVDGLSAQWILQGYLEQLRYEQS